MILRKYHIFIFEDQEYYFDFNENFCEIQIGIE